MLDAIGFLSFGAPQLVLPRQFSVAYSSTFSILCQITPYFNQVAHDHMLVTFLYIYMYIYIYICFIHIYTVFDLLY